MLYHKSTLKLSRDGFAALNHWLKYVTTAESNGNYYIDLMRLELGVWWQKKIYPKTAILQDEYKFKLTPPVSLALSLSFYQFDYFDLGDYWAAQLFQISTSLPKLYNDRSKLNAPLLTGLLETYEEE